MTVVQYDRAVAQDVQRRGAGSQFNAEWLLDPAEIANRIGGTDFVPKAMRSNPAAITAALLYGAEVGLGPMMSLSRIAVIDGRPTLAAEAQRALILAAGHDLWVEESNNTRCTIAGRRSNSEMTSRVTWTLDDAKRAKIAGKANWQSYPRAMLLARASAELARSVFADVIGGLAATEEVEDYDVIEPAPAALEAATPTPSRRRRRVGTTAGAASSSATTTQSPEPQQPATTVPDEQPTPDPGQPPAPEPPPPAAETPAESAAETPAPPDPPTVDSLKLLFALFGERGLKDRDERLKYSEDTLGQFEPGRRITSSKDLTALDVSRLIDALKAEPALQPNEQAVVDALADELAAEPVPPPDPPVPPAPPPPPTPADPPVPGDEPQPHEFGEFPAGY